MIFVSCNWTYGTCATFEKRRIPSSWFCRVKLQLWFWDVVLQVSCRELTKAGYSSQFSPVRCPDIVLLVLLLWRRGEWNVRLRQDISSEIRQCHQAISILWCRCVNVLCGVILCHFCRILNEHTFNYIFQGYIDLKQNTDSDSLNNFTVNPSRLI